MRPAVWRWTRTAASKESARRSRSARPRHASRKSAHYTGAAGATWIQVRADQAVRARRRRLQNAARSINSTLTERAKGRGQVWSPRQRRGKRAVVALYAAVNRGAYRLAHQSILAYARYRYLKIATAAVVVAIAAYAWDRPPNGRYGGTWLGYTLGTVGALLIFWLLWFGVRKRRYASNAGMVQGWLSAHCYFGTALIVIATLHAAFKFGWNVHTLGRPLMLVSKISGFYGGDAYLQ